jgi:hypothetical protein
LGKDITEQDVKHLIEILPRVVSDLRDISPSSVKEGLEEDDEAKKE